MKTETNTKNNTKNKLKTYYIEYSETLVYKEYIQAESEADANAKFFEDFNYDPDQTESNYLEITESED